MPSSDIVKIIWNNLRQKPVYDRVFYVPFWECPFNCDFCCVDSLPGKPKQSFKEGEDFLFSFLKTYSEKVGRPIGLHYYGGEPLLRPQAFLDVAKRAETSGYVSKIYLYSTLRLKHSLETVQQVPKDFLRIIVNDFRADDLVLENMKALKGVAEYYDNPVVFHTGRARGQEDSHKNKSFRKTLYEKSFPPSFPGRSCFANVSGPLINVPHKKIHLCCLPQSPVFGGFEESSDALVDTYMSAVKNYYKIVDREMRDCKQSHACSVCEKWSKWDTYKVPEFTLEQNI